MGQKLNWTDLEREAQLKQALSDLAEFGGPMPKKDSEALLSSATSQDLLTTFRVLADDEGVMTSSEEVAQAAQALGFPFRDEEDAKLAFEDMQEPHGSGVVDETAFIDWWRQTKDEEIRLSIDKQLMLNVDKVTGSTGVMFG
uniref:Calmodulin n=2 Tax=Octactis speculum TaxID=3111310 RepID=A0A7S2GP20_9STRA|mmetsp:Transcript_53512/g.73103  ORF Transcript_53512/g.73103 Transcript_53512/m.73103 type:complete len:142 (+) Transcript_53512:19-444(+)